ncbi:response regulator transcription factor [Cohnella mopanensis]|uniref:response regulator transcription factor n=1 Tax=Cohnella mopanensis TaxID=2911966 RepID=UPI001EF809F0|nr:response regulator [Cohnella mopanensis]
MTNADNSIRIVVAEDEDLIRNNLIKKIEGIDDALKVVYAAEDGKSALNYIRNNAADLIVTDIRMPVMDGLELIKSLQSHYPHIRKIITTGYADFEYARQAVRYEASEYLLKPIKSSELQKAISRIQTSIETEKSRYNKNVAEGLRVQGAVSSEDIVGQVQHYLRENFTRDISLEEISRQFNFTPSYLSKIFIKHTGEAPSKYLISLRINEAKYLLANHPSLSVKEVAERVGYPDQFYFSRLFKQVAGCTPKEYQK